MRELVVSNRQLLGLGKIKLFEERKKESTQAVHAKFAIWSMESHTPPPRFKRQYVDCGDVLEIVGDLCKADWVLRIGHGKGPEHHVK